MRRRSPRGSIGIALVLLGSVALLVGSCSSPARHDPAELVGGWRLASYRNSDGEVAAVTAPASTIEFTADGRVSGTTGCNRFGGRYETAGEVLKFSAVGMTQMMCTGDGLTEQETAYTVAFQKSQTLMIDGRTLTIAANDGVTALKFARD